MQPERPNILILMPDTMRHDTMGCAGDGVTQTPNMDRLAAEGVRFANACTNSPLCMPARACFITGQYPHNHHMWANSHRLPVSAESLFLHLQHVGYRTAHIGKSHYYNHGPLHLREEEPYMHARGFTDLWETTGPWATVGTDSYLTDHWDRKGLTEVFRSDYRRRREAGAWEPWPSPLPEEDHPDSYVGRKATEYLRAYDDARPFCLFVGFPGPHDPYDPPESLAGMYRPEQMPPAIAPGEPGDWLPPPVREQMGKLAAAHRAPEKVGLLRALYSANVSLIDRWFGELLSVLDERGWTQDTLVVYWSDHGDQLGDHGRLAKSVFYEASLRVPMVLRWPAQIRPGLVREQLASTVDLLPTILQAAHVEVGEHCQGTSLWPVIEDAGAPFPDQVLSEICPAPMGHVMVRTARWKYAMTRTGEGTMLFDLERDPQERENLASHPDYAQIEREMRDRLLAALADKQPVL
jgi:arylsulfatase